jgi:hypothetical protein
VAILMKGSLHTDELLHACWPNQPCVPVAACRTCSALTCPCTPSP